MPPEISPEGSSFRRRCLAFAYNRGVSAHGDTHKGHFSIARVIDDWYIACSSRELGHKPLRRQLWGTPIVLFRGEGGRPCALLDRCAHRNAPLSLGKTVGSRIECRYHGWQFDGGGACRSVPGLLTAPEKPGRSIPSYACREQDGFIWIFATPDTDPPREPFRFPYLEEPGYVTVRQSFDMKGTIHAVAENALDVPHTAFLHRGWFRGNRLPCEIEVVVRRWHDRIEAEYKGEPRPAGLVGRVLAPSGGVVQHVDRFLLPSIAQVEYRLGDQNHLCVSSALTPLDDFETRLFSTLTFRLRVPGRPLALALRPIAIRILKQDAWILRRQTEAILHFGGEQYVSTDLDALGPHILRLLKDAEQGKRTAVSQPLTRAFRMKV
ncbi:MAG TPA: aromatic ring-hydroxylating dioxygenase subunit alpha [Vicinamibacteria bacterium]